MFDDKRREREFKRQIKKQGARRRRRFLKDLANLPEDFEFGTERSQVLNQPRSRRVEYPEEFD